MKRKTLIINIILTTIIYIIVEVFCFRLFDNSVSYSVPFIQKSLEDCLAKYPPERYKQYEKKENNNKKPILFVGCSYTLGEALEDEDTMPAKIEKLTNRYGYNWGISGYGAVQALILFLLENKYHLINEEPEYIIYTYMFHHLDRFQEPEIFNFYRKNNYIPIQKYNNLYKSYIYRRIKDIELSNYLYNNGELDIQLNLFYTIMKDIKKQSEKLFPNSKFVILIYSDINYDLCRNLMGQDDENKFRINKMFEIMYSEDFKKNLENMGYTVITTEELIGRKMYRQEDRNPKTIDPNYPHPSSKAWDEIVPKLIQKLNL